MNFAVIRLFGKQHLVNEGSFVHVQAPMADGQKNLDIAEVLLLSKDGNLKLGTPLVDGVTLKAQVVSTGKGQKIDVFKFKAKSRYRRKIGFRPFDSVLKITGLEEDDKQSSLEAKNKSPKAKTAKTKKS